jgi:POT family proton-dependent oligopeptide transporter
MWERFSFYGMRALLVLYLVNSLNYSHNNALHIYAVYTGMVYLTPIIGGYIADKYINDVNAITLGGVLMMIGHFLLSFESLIFLGLSFLVCGNGFFKPNISSMLGNLYKNKQNDLRDEGFSFFYIGINIGAFLAPLSIGFIGEYFNWHLGFMMAALGMLVGLIVFLRKAVSSKEIKSPLIPNLIFKCLFIVSFINIFVFLSPTIITLIIIGAASTYYLVSKSYQNNIPDLKIKKNLNNIKYILFLGFFSIIFWIGFEQAGGFLTLFTDTRVDKHIFGFNVPTSLFLAINPLLIVAFGSLVAKLWSRLGAKIVIETPHKMACGLILLGIGFGFLVLLKNQNEIHFLWIVLVYFFHTLGELCISPTSLSMVTVVSPHKIRSFMVGVWFFTFAIASYLAGIIPGLLESFDVNLFTFLTIISVTSGILLLYLSKGFRKLL